MCPAASWQLDTTSWQFLGKLAACGYDLAIFKKSFLFLRTSVFAACGRRAIMKVQAGFSKARWVGIHPMLVPFLTANDIPSYMQKQCSRLRRERLCRVSCN
jgi:hypothetical protein